MMMDQGMTWRSAFLLRVLLVAVISMIMLIENFDAVSSQQIVGMRSFGRDKAAKQNGKHKEHREEADPHITSPTSHSRIQQENAHD